jgi:hypothetical protein
MLGARAQRTLRWIKSLAWASGCAADHRTGDTSGVATGNVS